MKSLQEVLAKHPNITAKRLAKLVGCSVPTIYRQVEALQKSGVKIISFQLYTTAAKTGPRPALYALVRS